MSIWSFLARLCLSYLVLFAAWNLVASHLGFGGGNWVHAGIVLAATYALCTQFADRNRRYFSRREKLIAVAGFVLFDLLLWLVRSVVALGAMARVQGGMASVGYGTIVFSTVFVVGFHLLAFVAAMTLVERRRQTSGGLA